MICVFSTWISTSNVADKLEPLTYQNGSNAYKGGSVINQIPPYIPCMLLLIEYACR